MEDNLNNSYIEISGGALEVVPKALENGGTFLTMPQLMDLRIEVARTRDEKLIVAYFGKKFLTRTPLFYDKKGNVAIGDITDERVMNYVRQITPALGGQLYNGRMVLPDDFRIEDIPGAVFSGREVQKYCDFLMSEKEVRKNPIWSALAGEDNVTRIFDYTDTVFELGQRYHVRNKSMGIELSNSVDKNTMTLFNLGALNEFNYSMARDQDLCLEAKLLVPSSQMSQKK